MVFFFISIYAQNFNELMGTFTYANSRQLDVVINIDKGSLRVVNSFDERLTIDCDHMTKPLEIEEHEVLEFKSKILTNCTLVVPWGRSVTVKGKQLNASFDRLRNDVTVDID